MMILNQDLLGLICDNTEDKDFVIFFQNFFSPKTFVS